MNPKLPAYVLCLWWLLYGAGVLRAQNRYTDISEHSVSRYTDENGLPQNSVKGIAADEAGFMWLVTESGLVRFDGKNFKVFDKGNIGISSGRLWGLSPGRDAGEMFCANDRHEVIRIAGGTARTTGDLPKLAYYLYYEYLKDFKGDVKFGHPVYNRIPLGTATHVLVSDHRSFFACSARHIRYYVGNRLIFDMPYRMDPRWHFFMLEGRLYAHTEGNRFIPLYQKTLVPITAEGLPPARPGDRVPLLYWNGATRATYFYRNNELYRLYGMPDGRLRARLVLSGFPLEKHSIYTVYQHPKNKTIFLGSSTEGLYVLKRHDFETLDNRLGGNSDVFYAHGYYRDNAIISTQGYLLRPGMPPELFEAGAKERKEFWGYSLLVSEHTPSIWMGRDHALIEYDRERRRKRQIALPETAVLISEGMDGKLWLGIRHRGIFRLDPGKPDAQPEPFVDIRTHSYLYQTDPHYLWVGAFDGLYRVSLDNGHIDTVHGIAGIYVRSLYSDQPGRMWITTSDDGLFLLRGTSLIHFPTDRNRYLSAAHCILEDRKGDFWISTNKGLFRVSKKDLLAYADGESHTVYYFYYGKESGFNTNEFNGGCQPCGVKWPNGNFSFPSLNGLVWFNPDTVRPEFPDREIFLREIDLDGRPLEFADTLTLPYDFQRITFFVSTPYMGNFNNLYLETSLQKNGGEDIWTPMRGDNAISFTTLPPGNYRLGIRKPKGFGLDNYTYKTVVLMIPPAFWQTGWFMALMGIVFLLAVYYLILSRTRYVRRRNVELERIIRERTLDLRETVSALQRSQNTLERKSQLQQKMILAFSHDLKSPLLYLMLTGQKLYESLRATPGKLLDSVQIMYHSSFNMYHFTDNFLNYGKVYFLNEAPGSETFPLHALVNEKLEIFRYIAESKNIVIRNGIPVGMRVCMNRMLLSIILHNLLDNAIKYTDEGSVSFDVSVEGDVLHLSIADTGMGMDDEVKRRYADIVGVPQEEEYVQDGAGKGLGLQIVAELVHILGGRLRIDSVYERGTVVHLYFPIGAVE